MGLETQRIKRSKILFFKRVAQRRLVEESIKCVFAGSTCWAFKNLLAMARVSVIHRGGKMKFQHKWLIQYIHSLCLYRGTLITEGNREFLWPVTFCSERIRNCGWSYWNKFYTDNNISVINHWNAKKMSCLLLILKSVI